MVQLPHAVHNAMYQADYRLLIEHKFINSLLVILHVLYDPVHLTIPVNSADRTSFFIIHCIPP